MGDREEGRTSQEGKRQVTGGTGLRRGTGRGKRKKP
jgi:hypothetical protein